MMKKKFKFQVNFEVCELDSIPFVNGVLFAKVRLLAGGNFSELSAREEVLNNSVHWGAKFKFTCRMSANATTGILDTCCCRVSIRKEIKGGKSFIKYGFVDLNLAELAGAGCVSKRYLLEGYDSKIRQDNSTVKVKIEMSLLSGDSLFKAPNAKAVTSLLQDVGDETLQRSIKGDASNVMNFSQAGSSGRHTVKQRPSLLNSGLVQTSATESEVKCLTSEDEFHQSHSRSSSYNSHESQSGSQQSRGSGYSSTHSRSSSLTEHFSSATSLTEPMQEKEQGGGSARESGSWSGSWRGVGSNERRRKHPEESTQQKRVEDTRVDADEIVKDIISKQDFREGVTEEHGLQLFIARDGSTAFGSIQLKNRMSQGVFEKVVIIDQR